MLESMGTGMIAVESSDHALMLKQLLAANGLEARLAVDKKQALQMLRKDNFTLAVIDIGLLGARPQNFISKFRSEGLRCGIIIIFPENQINKIPALLSGGADDYLISPFDAPGAKHIIGRLLLVLKNGISLSRPENLSTQDASLSHLIRERLRPFFERIDNTGSINWHGKLMTEFERELIGLAIKKYKGNRTQAARLLGINRNTLSKRMRVLEIKTEDE